MKQPLRQIPNYRKYEFAEKRNPYCVCVFVINEGEKLLGQLAAMRPVCDGLVDVVVADGGSSDGSTEHEKLKSLGVNTLLVKQDSGKLGSQMRMAFDWALDRAYEGVIVVDGNGKDGMDAIPRFVEELKNGGDHVQGSRFIPGGHHENTPKSRLLGLKLLHVPLMRLASGFPYTDTTNGFRAYSAKLLRSDKLRIFRDCFSGYELHYYLAVEAPRRGFRCSEIPVSRVYPSRGKVPTKISGVKGNLNVIKKLLLACWLWYTPTSLSKYLRIAKAVCLPVLLVAAFVFLYNSYCGNTLKLENPDCGMGMLSGDQHIIPHRLTDYDRGKVAVWYKMGPPKAPYMQSVGIQGIISGIVYKHFTSSSLKAEERIEATRKCLIFLAVLTLFAIVLWGCREFGLLTAAVGYATLVFSPWLLPYCRSFYWMPVTIVLPFVVCVAFFRNRSRLSKTAAVAASVLLYLAMIVRFACGFEFVPCAFFSAFIPLTYYAVKYAWSPFRYLAHIAAAALIGLAGFATTILLNIVQGMLMTRISFSRAVDLFLGNMMYRTGIGNSGVDPIYFDSFMSRLEDIFHTYFCTRTPLTMNLRFVDVSCWFILSLLLFLFVFARRNENFPSDGDRKVLALFAAGAVAFLSPVSWLVLAKGHSHWHPHIVFVIFLLPAVAIMLMAAVYPLVHLIRLLCTNIRANLRRLGRFIIFALAGGAIWFIWEYQNYSGYKIIAKYVVSRPDFKYKQFHGKLINGKLWIVSTRNAHLSRYFYLHCIPYSGRVEHHTFFWEKSEVRLPFFIPYRIVIKDYNPVTHKALRFGRFDLDPQRRIVPLWHVDHKTPPPPVAFRLPDWKNDRQTLLRNCSPEMAETLKIVFFFLPPDRIVAVTRLVDCFAFNRQGLLLAEIRPVRPPRLRVSDLTDKMFHNGVVRADPEVIVLETSRNLPWRMAFDRLKDARIDLGKAGIFVVRKVVWASQLVYLHLDRKIADPTTVAREFSPL